MPTFTTISAFQLLFGNIVGFSNWVNGKVKTDSVEELNTLFYKTFLKCIDKQKDKAEKNNSITFQQLKQLTRNNKTEIVVFFNKKISIQKTIGEVDVFGGGNTSIFSNFAKAFLKIIAKDNNELYQNIELIEKIVESAFEDFHIEIFNQLSEKQGI